jgi:signal transduction histidine kinase
MTLPNSPDVPAPIPPSDRAARLDAAARTSGALAHEMANYLGAIGTWVYILQEDLGKGPGARDELGFILESVETATRFIKDLRAFAHPHAFGPDRTDLSAVVRGLEPRLRESLPGAVRLELRLAAEPLWVNGRVAALESLVADLVARAAEAPGACATITVETSPGPDGGDGGAGVRLMVRDDGAALDADRVARFFEPFALGRVQGSGLRMALLYAAVREHGGTAGVESSAAGTCVTVDVPPWRPQERAAAER